MPPKRSSPGSKASRFQNTGAEVILPSKNLAGKARAKRPGSDFDRGQSIRNTLNQYTAKAIEQIRNRSDINEIIRALMREDGLFSSAANSMVALSANSGFRIAGYNSAGAMDLGVMSMAYSIVDRFSTLHDYSQGFNDKPGVQSLLTSLQIDVIGTGGCGVELVLDKTFGPERLVPVGYSTIVWEADGKGGRYPTQDSGEINLNLPTVFVAEHNRNPDEAYSVSLLRPGLTHTISFNEFLEDTHRAVNRTGHSRLVAKILAEKVWAAAPDDVKADPAKRQGYFNTVRAQVEAALKDIEPEDALVAYDSVEYEIKDTGGSKSDYSPMLSTLGNLLGASLKTPASVSGLRASGGQGLSNAETLIYLKVVEAARPPVEEVMSRALTLACRLLGVEGYIYFEFMPVNLRPEEELEAYKGTKQKRVLEQLSLGLINDAEACYQLGIRPQGLVAELAGTGFYAGANPNGGMATDEKKDEEAGDEGERDSSTGRSLNPSTPSKSGGKDQ
jgi:hypothetical protein